MTWIELARNGIQCSPERLGSIMSVGKLERVVFEMGFRSRSSAAFAESDLHYYANLHLT